MDPSGNVCTKYRRIIRSSCEGEYSIPVSLRINGLPLNAFVVRHREYCKLSPGM
jgi:hypothetical protein